MYAKNKTPNIKYTIKYTIPPKETPKRKHNNQYYQQINTNNNPTTKSNVSKTVHSQTIKPNKVQIKTQTNKQSTPKQTNAIKPPNKNITGTNPNQITSKTTKYQRIKTIIVNAKPQ